MKKTRQQLLDEIKMVWEFLKQANFIDLGKVITDSFEKNPQLTLRVKKTVDEILRNESLQNELGFNESDLKLGKEVVGLITSLQMFPKVDWMPDLNFFESAVKNDPLATESIISALMVTIDSLTNSYDSESTKITIFHELKHNDPEIFVKWVRMVEKADQMLDDSFIFHKMTNQERRKLQQFITTVKKVNSMN